MSIADALTDQRHSDRVIAAEYAAEYARGQEHAAMMIWWAILSGQAPDMMQYSYRPGVSAVWVNDADMGGLGGPIARDDGPVDWSWVTRENGLYQAQLDAQRARQAEEFEARVKANNLQVEDDKP